MTFPLFAKNENIKEVKAKKTDFLNTEFTLKGIIHDPDSTANADDYYLVDNSNDSIILRTQEELELGQEYRIEGKLKEKAGLLFFKAEDQECLDCDEDEDGESSTMLFVLTGLVAVLAVIIIFILNRQKMSNRNQATPFPQNPAPNQGFNQPNFNQPNLNQGNFNQPPNPGSNPNQVNQQGATDNFATIAFNPNQLPKQPITESKTVVMSQPEAKEDNLIPGSFSFNLNGQAEKIELKGFPTGLGYIATVGREAAETEKAESHLRIADPTVSRKQAEFIFESGNLYIRNLSGTNPSVLNGKEMGSGSLDQVLPGSQLKFGEVIVTYQA